MALATGWMPNSLCRACAPAAPSCWRRAGWAWSAARAAARAGASPGGVRIPFRARRTNQGAPEGGDVADHHRLGIAHGREEDQAKGLGTFQGGQADQHAPRKGWIELTDMQNAHGKFRDGSTG